MNGNKKQIGWYGETLNAVLDRKDSRKSWPQTVGYSAEQMKKLLG